MAGVEERIQLLLDDPDISKVEPHRVFCRRCAKWLKLDENKLYAASVWRCHKNTKSHNAKDAKLTASAPPPADDADSALTLNGSSSLSSSLPPSNRRKRTVSSTDSSLPSSSASTKNPYNGDPKPPSGSSEAKKVLPRLKLRFPAALRSGSAPVSTPLSGSASNALGSSSVSISVTGVPNNSSVLTVKKSRHTRSTNSVAPADSQTTPSKSNTSQESIAVASFSSDKTLAPPTLVDSVSQSSATSQTALPKNSGPSAGSPPPLKESEKVPATSERSESRELPPQLSPDRQASYNALLAEPAIETLEPFRAFCSVCQHWVDLSSRTPYSYGVWKGHVRKSEKHTRLQSGNNEKEYETASDNPDDETGLSPLKAGRAEDSDVANGADLTERSLNHPSNAVNGVTEKIVDAQNTKASVSVETCDKRGGRSTSPEALSLLYPEDAISPDEPENPFVLKAATEESFRPRLGAVKCKASPEIVEEDGDDEPASSFRLIGEAQRKELDGVQTSYETPTTTATSDGEPSSAVTSQNLTSSEAQPREMSKSLTKALRKTLFSEHDGVPASAQARQRLAQLKALEERREAMLADPDLAIVESRRVQCRRCDRWIKGSNTQEYSWHHWLKHKNKCALGQRRENDRWSVTAESRKERLEADPDLQMLEEHRALCKLCGKWVKLCSRSRYSASHWTQHKRKCPALLGLMSNGQMHQTEFNDAGIAARFGAENKEISRMPDELRIELATDPDVLQVLPHRVKCKHCDRWITLSTFMKDNKINWLLHKERCSRALANAISSTPGKQIALETRKKVLEEDSDVAVLEPHRVQCKACTSWVKLRQDSSYSLGNWLLHRRRCTEMARRTVSRDHRGDQDEDDNARPLEPETGTSDDEDALDALDIENWLRDESDKAPGPSPISAGSDHVDLGTSDSVDIDMEINGSSTHIRSNAGEVTFADNSNGKENEGSSLRGDQPAMDAAVKRPSITVGKRRVHEELSEPQAPVRGQPGQPVGRRKGRGQAVPRPTHPFLGGKGKAASFMRGHSIMTLPPLPPRPRWPGEDERKQQFVSDPDVLRVEPHRVLCKICNCWIRLHPNVRYLETVWSRHKESCRAVHSFDSGDARSRAKSEKEEVRWRLLDDDPYATDISPHRVTCKACGTNIRLDTTYKYEGSHWRAHRSRCLRIPSQDRAAKRRKTEPVKVPDSIAIADSSDSDDSDASSAPRPRPTAFFTSPLIIKPTEMFKRRSHAAQPPHKAAVKMDAEAEIAKELARISVELESRGRYETLLKLYGDGLVGEDGLIRPEEVQQADDDVDVVEDEDASKAPQQSDSESWVPLKRSREEYEKFDAFFSQLPVPPPAPLPTKGKVRVCSLAIEAMQVVE